MPKTARDRDVSYQDLTRLLQRQGFELKRVPGSHHLFVHHDSGTTILLPENSSAQPAMASQVAAVRRMLDERGLLARDNFDDAVRSARNGRATVKH